MGDKDVDMFPENRKIIPSFQFGPYIPIIKTEDKIVIDQQGAVDQFYQSNVPDIKKRLLGEIMPDDYIVDVPSLVTPLLLKKRTIWPPRVATPPTVSLPNHTDSSPSLNDGDDSPDDIQVLKVVPSNCDPPIIFSEKSTPKLRRPEQYIKDTVIANLLRRTRPTKEDPTLAIEDFNKTSAAELLVSIGINRVNQFLLEDQVKSIARKMRNGVQGLIPSYEKANHRLSKTRNFNRPYSLRCNLRCPHCDFHTESQIVLKSHLASPHINQYKQYTCNRCKFKTKDIRQIVSHNNVIHRDVCFKADQPLALHCCAQCTFETNSKCKFNSHLKKCAVSFDPNSVQVPEGGTDHPALTSKLIGRNDIKIYDETLKSYRLASYNPHHIEISAPDRGFVKHQILMLPSKPYSLPEVKGRNLQLSIFRAADPLVDVAESMTRRNTMVVKRPNPSSNQPDDSHLLRMLSSQACSKNIAKDRSSMLQYPRPQSSFNNGIGVGKSVSNIVMAPTTSEKISQPIEIDLTRDEPELPPSKKKSAFINCEICDVYIDDLLLLKKHMQIVHKVKIHHNIHQLKRPPLNCQKCDWRFFTDRGLERHLLGSHSLVTTNLQDLAEAGKDSGRCPICGMRCASKLVLHVKEIHKMTLKPAQLAYKCIVCSATFRLYRYFENHVYQVHADAMQAKNEN